MRTTGGGALPCKSQAVGDAALAANWIKASRSCPRSLRLQPTFQLVVRQGFRPARSEDLKFLWPPLRPKLTRRSNFKVVLRQQPTYYSEVSDFVRSGLSCSALSLQYWRRHCCCKLDEHRKDQSECLPQGLSTSSVCNV